LASSPLIMPAPIGPDDTRERWYYDACALDGGKSAYAEMFNTHNPIHPIISHLSFGEAYAAAHLKGEEAIGGFTSLMLALRPFVHVVQNDGRDGILQRVREQFPRLTITDAVHVATAIENRCVVIRTVDPDLLGLPPAELNALGAEFGLPHLSVTEMIFRH